MLAYVFCHWKRADVGTQDYEDRQRAFHAALWAAPPSGFVESFSVGVSDAPWAASPEAYEDWYLIEDFSALGLLNEAAISNSRAHSRPSPSRRACPIATCPLNSLRLSSR